MKVYPFVVSLVVVMSSSASAQRFTGKEQTTQTRVKPDTGFINAEKAYLAFKGGEIDDARKYLASADPENPFATYVRAALTENAAQAVGIYRVIVNEYPGKPIAREALLQLYKYHYAAGDYRLAHTDYVELCKYPGAAQLVDPLGLSDRVPSEKDSLQSAVSPASQQSPETPQTATTYEKGTYEVQLGVFSTRENADKFAADMKAEDVKASVSEKAGAAKTLYVVTTGNFPTRDAAVTFATSLKNRSIDCIVVKVGESRE
ncbi:MAG TPA: SPOR domain-containing protein [Candidatus Acidoferrales bacterium]|nr:SPOR domain-containing protein [Candidatus Acidoferrales bacterium]